MNQDQLIDQAKQARTFAYVPYSRFPVGAALVTENGQVFTGSNIENASFGLTNCAERTALFKALSEGHTKIQMIAVVADSPGPIAPCGACRQVMAELCPPHTPVILTNLNGDTRQTTVEELLPFAFIKEDLREQQD